jgi:mono/diheme cytochrome c family protein
MRGRTAGAIAVGTFVLGLAFASSSAVASARQDPPAPAAPAGKVDGAEIYKMRCQMCHQADGDSKMPHMSFADGEWLHGSTLAAVTNTITNGVEKTAMMPFKTQLSKEEIAALAKYVRKFDKKLK